MAVSSIKGDEMLLRFAFVLAFLGGSVFAMLFTGCNRQGRVQGKTMTAGPIVYVALGDSTGYGVGAREGGYVQRLFSRINERRPGSKLQNLCVSGATTEDLIRGQLDQAVALNPDLVTIGIGINDASHGFTVEQFATNYEKILSTLKEKTHAHIVVTNVPDVSSAPRIPSVMRSQFQRQIDEFSRRLEQIANQHGVTIFDVYTITKTELPSHPEYFSNDGFHPSDEGYELWATQMWPTVAKAIGEQ
jgi:acyl-CoA thioesterase I